MGSLDGKRVAILATDGFEQEELATPRDRLGGDGAWVHIVSPRACTIRGWDRIDWGEEIEVDRPLAEARVEDYDLLLIPGGRIGTDILRGCPAAVALVRDFVEAGRPVAALCQGTVLLVEADVVRGREVTGSRTIRTDLVNAGAFYRDAPTVCDHELITGRSAGDVDAFAEAVAAALRAPTVPARPQRAALAA